MKKKYNFKLNKSESKINEPVTKFGCQPNWLEDPQWPISEELNSQMRFICQISLQDELFPDSEGKMAYVFMTEDDEEYADGTWEPDGGENAIIVQPGGKISVKTVNKPTGPTREEHSVTLIPGEDENFIAESEVFKLSDDEAESYHASIAGNKIGGSPGFMQGDEIPQPEHEWNLLLQLDSCDVPFEINFGDAGIAYAFINRNNIEGKFLWQCA